MSTKRENVDTFQRYVDAIDISREHVDEIEKRRHIAARQKAQRPFREL